MSKQVQGWTPLVLLPVMPLYNEEESGARAVVTVTKEGRSSADRATDATELTARTDYPLEIVCKSWLYNPSVCNTSNSIRDEPPWINSNCDIVCPDYGRNR